MGRLTRRLTLLLVLSLAWSSLAGAQTVTGIRAFTAPGGSQIFSGVWQSDSTPYLQWTASPGGAPITGFSTAIDATPDCAIDTVLADIQLGVLADGSHSFQVRAIDSLGCGAPLSFDLRVDATPDAIALLVALTTPGGSSIITGVFQQDNDPLFIWTAASSAAPLAGSSFALDGAADCTIDTGTTSHQIAAVPDGIHSFQVRAIDSAGNCGAPATFDLRVDLTPDPIATLNGFTSPGGSQLVPDAWEPDPTPFMQWSPTPGAAPLAGYSFAPDGAADCSVDGTGTTYQFASLLNGSHSFQVRAIDAAGNCGPVSSFPFRVDSFVDTIFSLTLRRSPGGALINIYTNDPDPFADWSISFGGSGVAGVSWAIDATADCTPELSGFTTQLQLPALSEGSHSLHVRAVDLAGNCDPGMTKSFSVDFTGEPIASITALTAPGGTPILSGVIQPDSTPFMQWVPAPGVSPPRYNYEFNGSTGCSFETSTPSVQLPNIGDGSYPFEVRVVDEAGNCGPPSTFIIAIGITPQIGVPALPGAAPGLLIASLLLVLALAARRVTRSS